MQERYLFKAKRIDNGEWVEGFYVQRPNDPCGKKYYIVIIGRWIEVETASICQCTGLKDRNGKLIWENDIVKDDVIYGVVKWDDANARYIIDDRDDGYQEYSDWWHEVEVIGNVFDNPELMEVQL